MTKRSRVPGTASTRRLTKSQQRRLRKHVEREAELRRLASELGDKVEAVRIRRDE